MDATVLFRSETYAYKAKRLLSGLGISAGMIKNVDKRTGCGFGLRIKRERLYEAIRALRDNNVDYTLDLE